MFHLIQPFAPPCLLELRPGSPILRRAETIVIGLDLDDLDLLGFSDRNLELARCFLVLAELTEREMPRGDFHVHNDFALDVQEERRLLGVVGGYGDTLLERTGTASRVDGYLDFTLPARGNRVRRNDGRGATSRAFGAFDYQLCLALILHLEDMFDLRPLFDLPKVEGRLCRCDLGSQCGIRSCRRFAG